MWSTAALMSKAATHNSPLEFRSLTHFWAMATMRAGAEHKLCSGEQVIGKKVILSSADDNNFHNFIDDSEYDLQ